MLRWCTVHAQPIPCAYRRNHGTGAPTATSAVWTRPLPPPLHRGFPCPTPVMSFVSPHPTTIGYNSPLCAAPIGTPPAPSNQLSFIPFFWQRDAGGDRRGDPAHSTGVADQAGVAAVAARPPPTTAVRRPLSPSLLSLSISSLLLRRSRSCLDGIPLLPPPPLQFCGPVLFWSQSVRCRPTGPVCTHPPPLRLQRARLSVPGG